MAQGYRSKNMVKIKAGPNREIHIRQIWADGRELISIRDYYPETRTEGRGITIPRALFGTFMEGLNEVQEYLGSGSRVAGPGQERLF